MSFEIKLLVQRLKFLVKVLTVEKMQKIKYIIGIDEVGRGPIAGPLAIGCVKVPVSFDLSLLNGIRDSKKLIAKQREEWFRKINIMRKEGLLLFAVSFCTNNLIDKIGISKCLSLAIKRSLNKVGADPKYSLVLLDGGIKASPEFQYQKTIIKGDDKVPVISAASIVAKVKRDKRMKNYSKLFPEYEFEIHKGYGSRDHFDMVKKKGLTKFHRKTFLRKLKD